MGATTDRDQSCPLGPGLCKVVPNLDFTGQEYRLAGWGHERLGWVAVLVQKVRKAGGTEWMQDQVEGEMKVAQSEDWQP